MTIRPAWSWLILLLTFPVAQAGSAEALLDADLVSAIVGVAAATRPDGVVRVSWPRTAVPKPEGAWFFEYGKKVSVPSGDWSRLRVEVRGTRFAVSFNGEHLFELEDDTFSAPGRVGLWTTADSVTAFDDLNIKSYDAE